MKKKHTFIHFFSKTNRAEVIIDFSAEIPVVTSTKPTIISQKELEIYFRWIGFISRIMVDYASNKQLKYLAEKGYSVTKPESSIK